MKKLKRLFGLLAITSMYLFMSLSTAITAYAEEEDPIIDFFVLPITTGIYYWQENNGIYFIYNPNIPSTTFADTTLLEFYNTANEDLTPATDTTLTVAYLKNSASITSSSIKVTELKDEIEYIMTHQEAFLAVYEEIVIVDIQHLVLNDSLFTSDLVAKIEVKPNSYVSITYDVWYMSTTLNNIDDMFSMLIKYRNNVEEYWLNLGRDYTQAYTNGYYQGYAVSRSEFGIYIDGNWLSAEEYAIIVADELQEQIDVLQVQIDHLRQQLADFQYGAVDHFLLEFDNWIIPAITIAVIGGGIFMLLNKKRGA